VRTAIRKHMGDFLAILGLVVFALGIGGYIAVHERLSLPFISSTPFPINADFSTAQAVTPGQGQTVRIAGVQVGSIGGVSLKEGHAVVRLDIDPKYRHLIHADASALLRPKTGLKDMFVELDPGTKNAPLMPKDGTIPVGNTAPDINQDEILSALDTDTRSYLQLLINGLGNGLRGRSRDLRNVFKQLGPTHQDLARVAKAVAERRQNLRRLVHNYGQLTAELADKDHQITNLVDASNAVFRAFANENQNVSAAVARLPGTLNTTATTLQKVNTLAGVMGPSLDSLRPAFRQLNTANHQVLPFVKEAAPIIRTQIRPFVRTARPYVSDSLKPAAINLARAIPDLTGGFHELNRFFNIGAYNPAGRQRVSDACAGTDPSHPGGACSQAELNMPKGYLYWLAWVAQNSNSLFSTSDAEGPFRRALFMFDCNSIHALLDQFGGSADLLLGPITSVATDAKFCGGPSK
jgi:phospholipid/cholesterol/gamma-HCH transport system substrate-binding protein